MNETLLYRYNPWWEGPFDPSGILERSFLLKALGQQLTNKQVVFLTGLRRIGKTTLMKLFIKHLIDNKINPRHIIYISLDDYLLSKKSIIELHEEFRKIHKLKSGDFVYLFLDEVTYQKDFEIQLKNIFDQGNAKIFASSSSASLLKSKKHHLTGRNTVLEVLPLDFNEFLSFRNISLKKSEAHLLEPYFEDYLKMGGIPEYVLKGDITYLKELVEDIIQKDIAAAHNIKQIQTLRDFFLLLMERSGKIGSINKMARILGISPDTAKRYLDLFADTYLIYLMPRYGKTNETILAPKKIYAADLGIRTFFTGFRDKGSLFENYVYLKIKHQNPRYIYSNGIELDFFTENKLLIEAKYQSQLEGKQKVLFDQFKAKNKMVIRNFSDIKL